MDLSTHKIIDLLPERTVESVIAWLEAHPEVEIVSRDRGGVYVDGATQGAPLATQVCERWHSLKTWDRNHHHLRLRILWGNLA